MTVHEDTCQNYDLIIIKQNKILGQYCHTMGIHIHFAGMTGECLHLTRRAGSPNVQSFVVVLVMQCFSKNMIDISNQ